MSYHGKYSSGGSDSRRHRDSSSSRRSSPPRHRSRRSPSPGPSRGRSSPSRPRDPKVLPESFGRIQDSGRIDDDRNILQRMKNSYDNSPLAGLYTCVKEQRKLKIWTRNYKEVRGVMTGFIIAFDKHWNLILKDVDEVFLKQKKNKTPFLREIAPSENLPDIPAKVPREKKNKPEGSASEPKQPEKEAEASEKPEKKKKRKKKSKTVTEKRHVEKLFIRGDNVVMICPLLDEAMAAEEAEEEEEEGETRETG